VIDPGLHGLREGVVRLLRIRREESAADAARDASRSAGDDEDRRRTRTDEEGGVLTEPLTDVEGVPELGSGAL